MPLPLGRFLNWPLAMASSMRSFARLVNPVIVVGIGRAPGENRSFNSLRHFSRSCSDMSFCWLNAYMEVLSRALARRSAAEMFFLGTGRRFTGGGRGAFKGVRSLLWES